MVILFYINQLLINCLSSYGVMCSDIYNTQIHVSFLDCISKQHRSSKRSPRQNYSNRLEAQTMPIPYLDAYGCKWYWRDSDGHWKYSGENDWQPSSLSYNISRPSEHLLSITSKVLGLVNVLSADLSSNMFRMSDIFLDVVYMEETEITPSSLPLSVKEQLDELKIKHGDSTYGSILSLILPVGEDLGCEFMNFHEFDVIRMKTAIAFGYLMQMAWFNDVVALMEEVDKLLVCREFIDIKGALVYRIYGRISSVQKRLLNHRSILTRMVSSGIEHIFDDLLPKVLSFLF